MEMVNRKTNSKTKMCDSAAPLVKCGMAFIFLSDDNIIYGFLRKKMLLE